jgi:hypothetical protein
LRRSFLDSVRDRVSSRSIATCRDNRSPYKK